MYIERVEKKVGEKTHVQVLMRHSYRDKGRVRKRTVCNLTHFPPKQVQAIEWALKHPDEVEAAMALSGGAFEMEEGKSIGAVWALAEVARRLGIAKALGSQRQGHLALWQVLARVLEQGSRLSAVRLHEFYALAEAVGLKRGFDEDDLYDNLAWLSQHQAAIEDEVFKARRKKGAPPPALFLYDVTSSYLEGQCNALGDYGYNRDGKRGKKQIVVGLLCEETGEPVSVEVFGGSTPDMKTLGSQVQKTAERFGCEKVTFVGDRGMIKKANKEELNEASFSYITALTKQQIEGLLNRGSLQMELFDTAVCEVNLDGRRLVLRRNPVRAQEMAAGRESKRAAIQALADQQTAYLQDHPRARTETALKRVQAKIDTLRVAGWLRVSAEGRVLRLHTDEAALEDESRLDGCYVLETDVPEDAASAETIHSRYKDLTLVENAFRTCKTGHLELRPIYVRNEASTRGHVFVVMLAYLIRRELQRAWAHLNLTVEEGLKNLNTLCVMKLHITEDAKIQKIPTPRPQSQTLLKALGVTLPSYIPTAELRVATKKKLPQNRKTP